MRQTVEAMEPVAERGGVAMRFDQAGDPFAMVRAESVAQIADNLIANAVKYTPSGGTVTVALGPSDGGHARLSVADDGIGIPADELPQLFERFFRASSAVEAQIPGTGLGLAVTKALVERAGGTIDVSSEAGKGTRFDVVLPTVA